MKFINITFINGDGHDYGGAIHSEHGGKVYADTCIFKDNKANENGGAISVAGEQFYKLGKKILTKDKNQIPKNSSTTFVFIAEY